MQPEMTHPPQQLPAQKSYSYLQAMGIKLWVPRFQLPGAAPSLPCQWPTGQAKPQLSNTNKASALLEAATSQPKQPTIPKAEEVVAPAISEPVIPTEAQFSPLQLNVWQLANSWQLVLPQQLSAPALSLLNNILLALHPQTLGQLQQLTFNWPLANLPSNLTKEEAALSLQTFLSGANFSQLKPKGCLIFVPEVEQLLPLLNASLTNYFYLAPSLESMLEQPLLKAEFWQQAQASGLLSNFCATRVE